MINSRRPSWKPDWRPALLVLFLAGSRLPAQAASARPNVLFVAVDDLRTELGCYGVERVKSPNIDGLAARGTVFRRAYCQQAICSPSRTSLLTGCRPDTTRVYDLEADFRTALPNIVTLPQAFKQAGYTTAGIGKIWHHGHREAAGWSIPWWRPTAGQYHLPANRKLVGDKEAAATERKLTGAARHLATLGPPFEIADAPDSEYLDGQIADRAIAALGELHERPFFLAVGFRKPHLPFCAPQKYWDWYDHDQVALAANPQPPANFPDIAGSNWNELRFYHGMPREGAVPTEEARQLVHAYLACVSFIDAQIGRVLAELARLGLTENTIVVLWGDHGWKLGEHGMWCKQTNFENDTRAPLIVVVPGQKAAGRSTDALVEFVDIYPTLCELAGLPKPAALEGASFARLLDNPELAWKPAAFSQWLQRKQNVMGRSMRTDRYRYTEWRNQKTNQVLARELYDHETDPAENVNLVDDPAQADNFKRLAAMLGAGWQTGTRP